MRKKEPLRYIENAKEILKKSGIEANYYTDIKYVKTALGCAYLGILKAIDEFLLSKGLTKERLPKKTEEYEKALKRYGGVHNGRLMRHFNNLYHQLHIAGYYRGDLRSVKIIKEALSGAKEFIEKILPEKGGV
ncbi:MAG: DUF5618 family protein [Thermodesulfovibrionales bacterium]